MVSNKNKNNSQSLFLLKDFRDEKEISDFFEKNLNKIFPNLILIESLWKIPIRDIDDNEGVYGLQRAFKMAGVKHVLMSLWKVPDEETTELMLMFYSSLLKGNDADSALHNAQMEMSKKYSPYYWAGFILTE